jgi:hypothetical protein
MSTRNDFLVVGEQTFAGVESFPTLPTGREVPVGYVCLVGRVWLWWWDQENTVLSSAKTQDNGEHDSEFFHRI